MSLRDATHVIPFIMHVRALPANGHILLHDFYKIVCASTGVCACMQVATLLTCALLGSAMLFTYFCAIGWLWAASTQPPLMYGLLIFLFLPLPVNFLFPVSSPGVPCQKCAECDVECMKSVLSTQEFLLEACI